MRNAKATILVILTIFMPLQFPGLAFAQKQKIVVMDLTVSRPKKNFNELPKGWRLKVWQGKADIQLVQDEDEDAKVLRMRSEKASFYIYREMNMDVRKFPLLSWKWKITKLPEGADARKNTSDDQAAGIYVIFPKFPSFVNSKLIAYVWETSAPVGAIVKSRKNPMVHYIVVRSGTRNLDEWITEKRNVLDDYRRVFGSEPPELGGVALAVDADDTFSNAESYFAKIEFNSHPSRVAAAPEYTRLAQLTKLP